MTHVVPLTDSALTAELGRLARCEREVTATLIVHLGEFDARRLYEGAGHPSMFSYCRAVLRLSEDAAYNRIKAARMARRYPSIVAMLVEGSLSATTVRLLAPHLTLENHADLLAAASGKGKDDVEELLARRSPQADVAASVRKVPVRNVASVADGAPHEAIAVPLPPSTCVASPVPVAKPTVVRPVAPDRYEIRFTASTRLRDKLREAQDLLGHAIPSGDIAAVVERALTVLVDELQRRKFAATTRPRSSPAPASESRTVPAAVRREVAARDGGRCAFVSGDGRRCDARRFVEFHHLVPFAAGGRATTANIELRCRAHNGHEVDRFFGPGKRHTRESSASPT